MKTLTSTVWRLHGATFPTVDVPPYASRSLARLPASERTRFRRAWRWLGNGGIVTLVREGDMALSGAGVCEALLARSWAARHRDQWEMLCLALAAREVATELRAKSIGKSLVADLQARTYGELANAYRVAGRLHDAREAFGEAFCRLPGGSNDPYLVCHLEQLEATLCGATEGYDVAVFRLSALAEIYRNLGEPHLAGRARITQSIYAAHSGRKDEALRLNAEGLALIDRMRDPLLAMTALHNRLLLLEGLGLVDQARRTLAEVRYFTAGVRLCAVTLRLRWMEGRVQHRLGDLERAETSLHRSRNGLVVLGLRFFSAVASLDLAATLLRRGRTEDGQAEVDMARFIFQEMPDRNEHLEKVMRLESALKKGDATVEQLDGALSWLRRQEMESGPRSVFDLRP